MYLPVAIAHKSLGGKVMNLKFISIPIINKPCRKRAALALTLLVVLFAGLCTACNETEVKNISTSDYKAQIESFAWDAINRDIANYELSPGVNITDSKITKLELIETFDALADKPIYVYALEYRLLPEDLSKVVLAGGMSVDKDGWLKETCSMGSPLLVIKDNNDEAELIGILWTGEGLSGMEAEIKALLERN